MTKTIATLYKSNGEEVAITPDNGKDFSLEELNKFVGGYIEIIPLKDHMYLIMNEEGKLMNLPPNLKATELWNQTYGPTDVIVGDVLYCGKKYVK